MRSFTIALCLLASASFAQGKTEPRPQTVDFTATEIAADREVPMGTYYGIPPKPRFPSLIKVRISMNDKLAESVHEM